MPEEGKTDKETAEVLRSRFDGLLEESKTLTSRISESVRLLGFGLLATFYTVYTDKKFDALLASSSSSKLLLFTLGTCGAVAILFDYLQYVAGAKSVREAMARPDKLYDPNSLAYRARRHLYYAKQAPIIIGCLALIGFVLTTAAIIRVVPS